MKKSIFILIVITACGYGVKSAAAQTSQSVLYVPLIGITSVPDPLALPSGAGNVTYHYAVKSLVQDLPLSDVRVTDDICNPVAFVEGDDNGDGHLDYDETWRYSCTTKISTTTQSIAMATGVANGIQAVHKAYATVVVGRKDPAPLVSIVNITKVAYPLSLPAEGGPITFTYRVNNPGSTPLSGVIVVDDKCASMSGKLGDTNGNGLLDVNEVWIYTCTTILKETTTNTASVMATANGLRATDSFSLTVKVAIASSSPSFPETGSSPSLKAVLWEVLAGILVLLSIFFFLRRGKKS